jgi:archaemetzincin
MTIGPSLVIVPINKLPNGLIPWLADQLIELFEFDVSKGEMTSPPENSYNPDRRQHNGSVLMEKLNRLPISKQQVLGLIDEDCYAPGLNFIFGQASLGGKEAFIALPRLRQSFYGLPDDLDLFRQRVLKEAIHELGHTWGLAHCPDDSCVMHFSNSLQDTDSKRNYFCSKCWSLLGWIAR